MAKALVLSDETLAEPVAPPRAARPTLAPAEKELKPQRLPQVPLQIRIGAADAKAIKRAALEADQTISDFMLACFHASMKE
jgi:hypothetical protein